jgi:hypothetical protein
VIPGGIVHEVRRCGLRRALRIATALTGWASVDEWESASVFMPVGVRRVFRDVRRDFPHADLSRAVVEVVHPAEGPGAVNGYEAVVSYRPGAKLAEIVKTIRAEAKEAGWREDPAEGVRGPHGPADCDPEDDTPLAVPDTFYQVPPDRPLR